jgi:hypothetical protein
VTGTPCPAFTAPLFLRHVKAHQAPGDERLSLVRAATANLRSVKAGYKLDASTTEWVRSIHAEFADAFDSVCGASVLKDRNAARRVGRDFRYRIHAFKQRNDYTRISAAIPEKYRVNSEAW